MFRKILIAVCAIFVVAVAASGWSAHQNKQRFNAVMAEYAKDKPTHR